MNKRPQESDVEFIEALASLLKQNDLSEIEVKREYGADNCLVVRVARQAAVTHVTSMQAPVATPPLSAPAPSGSPAQAPGDDPSDDPGVIPSPMVGTAYLQAEPGSPPFIKVGDTVTEGQTVLSIEAMKTMNQIPAPRAGTVKRILIEDGSPVEFGAPLLILE